MRLHFLSEFFCSFFAWYPKSAIAAEIANALSHAPSAAMLNPVMPSSSRMRVKALLRCVSSRVLRMRASTEATSLSMASCLSADTGERGFIAGWYRPLAFWSSSSTISASSAVNFSLRARATAVSSSISRNCASISLALIPSSSPALSRKTCASASIASFPASPLSMNSAFLSSSTCCAWYSFVAIRSSSAIASCTSGSPASAPSSPAPPLPPAPSPASSSRSVARTPTICPDRDNRSGAVWTLFCFPRKADEK
mmetsp:Transcript_6996/g.10950  ORF Transcript_6996/g.10950 Transcript_6996/m.10950 type:complete len:254 (+) Transcript_6996:1247-2008(+)